ncbi:hypothetical protein [Streptomyces sp. YS-3]|uniref:hypothetical protein n=1 Tax=Streptomyces sp. YS-3 TaxID=3381352 RepID=UPI003868B30E
MNNPDLALQALDSHVWPHGWDYALLFGALLYLAGRVEGARFWFQYVAGAGSQAAARCLYLLHLSRAGRSSPHPTS